MEVAHPAMGRECDAVMTATLDNAGPEANRCAGHILVVDDNNLNRDLLRIRLEREGYRVTDAADGQAALAALRARPYDLVLLDIMMPVLDGVDTLKAIKRDRSLHHIPVIMVSAMDEMETVAHCITHGADDYLNKPVNPILLKARVRSSLDRKRLLELDTPPGETDAAAASARAESVAGLLQSPHLAAMFALAKLVESKDPVTGEHLERVREYSRLIAEHLASLPKYAGVVDAAFVESVYVTSPLHDIGKVKTPDAVLLKPGKLDDREWAVMRRHAPEGAAALRAAQPQVENDPLLNMAADIAEYHHERWDGSGYPHGIAGERIPLAARIVALGDTYDALTTCHCYKDAIPHADSRTILVAERGRHFDPDIVDAFVAREEDFVATHQRFPRS